MYHHISPDYIKTTTTAAQFLRLCVTCLSVGQDLAHVIHRSLNRIGLLFFSLGDENHADHISGGRDVE
jgi:hypothetical protein